MRPSTGKESYGPARTPAHWRWGRRGFRRARQSPGSPALSILVDANARAPRTQSHRQRTGATVTQDIDIKALIRTVPDFPKPGVLFRDITTLLKQAHGFHAVVEKLDAAYRCRP